MLPLEQKTVKVRNTLNHEEEIPGLVSIIHISHVTMAMSKLFKLMIILKTRIKQSFTQLAIKSRRYLLASLHLSLTTAC